MFTTSWAPRLLATAVLAAGCAGAIAGPLSIHFEGGAFTLVGPTQTEAAYTESGLSFTPTGGDAMIDPSFCAVGAESCIRNNDSVYLMALNGAEVTLTASKRFRLHSFDAAYFPLPVPAGLFAGVSFGLALSGTLEGGGTVNQVVALPEDPAVAGDFRFASRVADPGFNQLVSLTFSACYFDGPSCVRGGSGFDALGLLSNDLQFALDNLSVTVGDPGTVPEPSAAWLVLLGLAGLTLSRRRRAR